MLGFPENTQIRKIIFKKIIYEKFKHELTPTRKQDIDNDIKK